MYPTASVDYGVLVLTVAPIAVSIIGGGLAMAWRLGRVQQTVHDLGEDVKELQSEVRYQTRERRR